MRTPHGLMWTPTARTGDPKLSAEAVVTILSSKKQQKVLAADFGVCQQTISKVKRRISYTQFGRTPGEIEYESWAQCR